MIFFFVLKKEFCFATQLVDICKNYDELIRIMRASA